MRVMISGSFIFGIYGEKSMFGCKQGLMLGQARVQEGGCGDEVSSGRFLGGSAGEGAGNGF